MFYNFGCFVPKLYNVGSYKGILLLVLIYNNFKIICIFCVYIFYTIDYVLREKLIVGTQVSANNEISLLEMIT